jgi:hypothetical protein
VTDPERLITSNVPRPVGTVYTPDISSVGRSLISGRLALVDPQPYFVVREATKEEYLSAWPGERLDRSVDWDKMYFYEVSTD